MLVAVHEIQVMLTIRVDHDGDVAVDVSVPEARKPVQVPGDDDVLDGVDRKVRPYVEEFARQAAQYGLLLERPSGERQDYRNVVAPSARVRSRIGTVNVASGRLAIDKVPQLAADEPLAQIVRNNGAPRGVKVYLTSPDRVEAGVRLCRKAVAIRDDVRARF